MRAPSHSHPCYNPHHDCRHDTNVQLDARIAFSLSASRIFFAAGTGVEQDLLPDEGDALAGGDGAGQDPLPDGIVGDALAALAALARADDDDERANEDGVFEPSHKPSSTWPI